MGNNRLLTYMGNNHYIYIVLFLVGIDQFRYSFLHLYFGVVVAILAHCYAFLRTNCIRFGMLLIFKSKIL